MEKTKLLPIDYCSIDRAAELLIEATGKTIKPADIEHWIIKSCIRPCVNTDIYLGRNEKRIKPEIEIILKDNEEVSSPEEVAEDLRNLSRYSKLSAFEVTPYDYLLTEIYRKNNIFGIWELGETVEILTSIFTGTSQNLSEEASNFFNGNLGISLYPIRSQDKPNTTIKHIVTYAEYKKINRTDIVVIYDDLLSVEYCINQNLMVTKENIENYFSAGYSPYQLPKHEPNSKHSSTLIKAISALSAYIPEDLYDELEEQLPNKYQLFVNVIKNIDELDDHMLTLPYSVLGHINDFLKSKKTNPLVPTTKTVAKWVEKGKSNQW